MIQRIRDVYNNPSTIFRIGIVFFLIITLVFITHEILQPFSTHLLEKIGNKPFSELDKEDFADFEKARNIESILDYFPFHQSGQFRITLHEKLYRRSIEFRELFYESTLYENTESRALLFERLEMLISYDGFRKSNENLTYDSLLYYLPEINSDTLIMLPKLGIDRINKRIIYTNYNDSIIVIVEPEYVAKMKLIKQLGTREIHGSYSDCDEKKIFYLQEEITQFYNKYKYGFLIYDISDFEHGKFRDIFTDYLP